MKITRRISSFIIFNEESILTTLNKMNASKSPFIFTVSDDGVLDGVVTGGDLRRWLTTSNVVDLDQPVTLIANKAVISLPIDAPHATIAGTFNEAVTALPLVDAHRRLVAIATPGSPEITIGGRTIGEKSPTYVIAEIGNNHQGSLEMARQLVDACLASGADCAKFQMRTMAAVYRGGARSSDASEDLGSQYTLDLLERFSLPQDDMLRVFDYCLSKGITPLCTPWDEESVNALDRWGMEAFKVASADMTNHPLLRHLAAKRKPLIISTGMSKETEIKEAVDLLRDMGVNSVFLHCNSTYPTPYKDVNLSYLPRLKAITGGIVGYSGHERGWHVPLAAVALGARIIEKHLTLDRSLEGNDHKVSLLPDELTALVSGIRDVEASMGEGQLRNLSQGERINRETLAKSVVAAISIRQGTRIERAMLDVTSPGKGLQPNRMVELIGREARRSLAPGDFFFPSDLDEPKAIARAFRLGRPWGIPVRYHDQRAMLAQSNPDLLEYHLSYKDMELPLERFFDEKLAVSYVVHAPELFAGDHVLDLASSDPGYRRRSMDELRRVVEVANALRPWHLAPERVLIVTNVGGFSESHPIARSERAALYDRVAEALGRIDTGGTEIIPQTMPPFPWHFGGQRYHNLFVEADEIVAFCKAHRMRVCLDVSHSKLACNHSGASFRSFLEAVGPYTAHLHIADASGVDGEGLQIGDGDMDFMALAADLDMFSPTASFIPEVWQGHKNGGEGFWFAMDRLEAAFKR